MQVVLLGRWRLDTDSSNRWRSDEALESVTVTFTSPLLITIKDTHSSHLRIPPNAFGTSRRVIKQPLLKLDCHRMKSKFQANALE